MYRICKKNIDFSNLLTVNFQYIENMKKTIYFLLSLTLFFSCKNNSIVNNDTIPKHDSLTLSSKFVNEDRVINVWTPPNYNESVDRFPVLYMPDGGIKEDFPHVANTLSKLLVEKKIPPFILVGIENTERGRDLTGFSESEYDKQFCPVTDGAKNFRAFITNELMPEINKSYKTNKSKGIIGESLAGLFVMETLFLKPDSFDFYIAIDPSLWWNNQYLVKNADSLLTNLPNRNTKLWFAGSDAKDISKATRRLEKILENDSTKKLTWKYSDEPNEKHSTIFRATKEKALIWSLN